MAVDLSKYKKSKYYKSGNVGENNQQTNQPKVVTTNIADRVMQRANNIMNSNASMIDRMKADAQSKGKVFSNKPVQTQEKNNVKYVDNQKMKPNIGIGIRNTAKTNSINSGKLPIAEPLKQPQNDSVKKYKEDKDVKDNSYSGILSKGAFSDGYQIGDVARTVLGTVASVPTRIVTGATKVAQDVGDYATYGIAQRSKSIGE